MPRNKFSVITTAMQAAVENEQKDTETLGEKMIRQLDEKLARKRFIKRIAITAAVAIPAAFALGYQLTSKTMEDETSSED